MKSFSKVYKKAQNDYTSAERTRIDNEHKAVVESVKKLYNIDRFSSLKESEKIFYRDMILEFWNKDVGLTPAGVKFLNEGVAALNDKSSGKRIERYIKNKIKTDAVAFFRGFDESSVKELKKSVEESTGKKIAISEYKRWCIDAISQVVAGEVKHYKF